MTKKEYEAALSKDAGHPVYLTDQEYGVLTQQTKGTTATAPVMSTKSAAAPKPTPAPKQSPNPVYDYGPEMAGILADDAKFGKPQPVAAPPTTTPVYTSVATMDGKAAPPTPKWTNVATIDGQAPAHPVYGQPGATPPNQTPKGEWAAAKTEAEDPWALEWQKAKKG